MSDAFKVAVIVLLGPFVLVFYFFGMVALINWCGKLWHYLFECPTDDKDTTV